MQKEQLLDIIKMNQYQINRLKEIWDKTEPKPSIETLVQITREGMREVDRIMAQERMGSLSYADEFTKYKRALCEATSSACTKQ